MKGDGSCAPASISGAVAVDAVPTYAYKVRAATHWPANPSRTINPIHEETGEVALTATAMKCILTIKNVSQCML